MGWKTQLEGITGRLPIDSLAWLARGNRLLHYPFWSQVNGWHQLLHDTQSWSADRLAAYQWDQACALMRHAYANVPFYRRTWHAHGLTPEDVTGIDQWRRLPFVTKSDLQEHAEELLAANVAPQQRTYVTTGGSTGMPVGIYFDKQASDAKELAFIVTLWERVGYKLGARNAILRGTVLSNGKLWKLVPQANQLQMSSYFLTDEHMPRYVEELCRFQPEFIQAYPSSISLLAKFMLAQQVSPPKGLKAILCGSENLYDWQRQQIEQAFHCRVYSWYGQTEKVCLAGECEHDHCLQIFPEYGLTELIDEGGQVIDEPGRVGEIVGTGFLSLAMPLLRYRTMDFAVYASDTCTYCNRAYRRFKRIEGRLQEFIVTSTGRYISMTAINMHSPVFDNVRQFRFHQDTPGQVVLRVVPKPSYAEVDTINIRHELAPKLGSDIHLTIVLTDEIPRTARGKYRFLDQELPITFGDR